VNRRHADLDLNQLRLVTEEISPGVYRQSPVIDPIDERLDAAMSHPAPSIVLLRCGEERPSEHHNCGRPLGELMETSEGLLFLAYRHLIDPAAQSLKPLNKKKVASRLKAVPTFLDEGPKRLEVSCARHGCGEVTRVVLESEWNRFLNDQESRTVEIRLRARQSQISIALTT
jgi:hypothetical protein